MTEDKRVEFEAKLRALSAELDAPEHRIPAERALRAEIREGVEQHRLIRALSWASAQNTFVY